MDEKFPETLHTNDIKNNLDILIYKGLIVNCTRTNTNHAYAETPKGVKIIMQFYKHINTLA